MMASAPTWTPTAEIFGSVRTSSVPRPVSPASGFAMQLMASFDHRSPNRFVVSLVAAVVLADLEADLCRVGAHGVTRLVHARADRDHAAQRPVLAGDRRHALVV